MEAIKEGLEAFDRGDYTVIDETKGLWESIKYSFPLEQSQSYKLSISQELKAQLGK